MADRHELVRFIGYGGLAEVWEGRDEVTGRRVAVKLLPCARNDPVGTARCIREARTAGALHHPGLVAVHDAGYDAADGSLFLVTEFLPGPDLSQVLAQDGPLAIPVAVDWTAQAAAALGGCGPVMAVGVPRAYDTGDHGGAVLFALAYVVLRALLWAALRSRPAFRSNTWNPFTCALAVASLSSSSVQ